MSRSLHWTAEPRPPASPWTRALRVLAAAVLQSASRALGRLAQAVAAPQRRRVATLPPQTVEFHAEAGAPEGALYVDGELVVRLPGVTRL